MARGTPQSTFPAFCSLLRQVSIDIDTSTFLEFPIFRAQRVLCNQRLDTTTANSCKYVVASVIDKGVGKQTKMYVIIIS